MKYFEVDELKQTFFNYFTNKCGYVKIAGSSLVPTSDNSVLFTPAGMHPLIPYITGIEKHPNGNKLVNIQNVIRTKTINRVGEVSFLTFFELFGAWVIGEYNKQDILFDVWEFLTKTLEIPEEQLYMTYFEGNDIHGKDIDTVNSWKNIGVKENHLCPTIKNWKGPYSYEKICGPNTRIFFDTGKVPCGQNCGPACNCGKYIEIWNNVFMEYNKTKDGIYEKMLIHNVDTGLGLERVLAIMNGKTSIYETELFAPIISKIEELTNTKFEGADESTVFALKVIADHIRSAVFVLGDDKAIVPSNVDQGYVLRRIIRRIMRYLKKLGKDEGVMTEIAKVIVDKYSPVYEELKRNEDFIYKELEREERIFNKTIDYGLKIATKTISEMPKGSVLDGRIAFKLYDTFGFPLEFTQELASEYGVSVDVEEFNNCYRKHQEKSRLGAEKKFKGGLADSTVETARLHTATHLLNGALRKVLGDDVVQKGSNITSERLRFDFTLDRKMTLEELKRVSDIVNEAIALDIPIICQEMTLEEARAAGAIGAFGDKYGEKVKVYTIGDYSKEICGGPHAKSTGELKNFKIIKEQSSSAKVRRIKAIIDYQ